MKDFLRGRVARMVPALRRGVSALLGDFSWRPPSWCGALALRCTRHPRFAIFICLAFLLAAFGGRRGYVWWQHRPKPHQIAVTVESIPVTRFSKERLYFPRLNLRFAESAAALDLIGVPLDATRVRLEPNRPGKWMWSSDRLLSFTPDSDWPADKNFRVILDRAALGPRVLLARYDFEASTPPFTGEIHQLEFYQDPTNPSVKQVTAELDFTHAVDREELTRHLTVKMLGDSPVIPKDAAQPFTLSGGLHQRQWFFRTAALNLPDKEDFLKLILTRGLSTLQGGAVTKDDGSDKVRIPDYGTLFHVKGLDTKIVNNDNDEPEQFVVIETSSAARSEDIAKTLQIHRLPRVNPHREKKPGVAAKEDDSKDEDADEDRDEETDERDESIPAIDRDGRYHLVQDGDDDSNTTIKADEAGDLERFDDWSPDEIDADALALSAPLPPVLVPSKEEQSTIHTFKIRSEQPGQLCVIIGAGTAAVGGFTLREDYKGVAAVPLPPRQVALEGKGGVLALAGERKLSVKSRGIQAIRYEIARVPAGEINHLASQTRGSFESPDFFYGHFNERDLARFTLETQAINLRSRVEANYSTFDFTSHLLPKDGMREGLFFLTASAWDTKKGKYIGGISDSRFILVTDLGLIVKANTDGSRDVFVQSVATGQPTAGVVVEILARNGVAVAHAETDPQGRASLPSLGKHPRDSREAVAITARRGDDVAFMPFNRDDRLLDYSRFEINGITQKTGRELDAFVFTERGVYRPGDTLHVGVIVKQRDWNGHLDGLPLEAEVRDARNASAQVSRLVLPVSGFTEFTCPTMYESPTGEYNIDVYLINDGKRSTLLGSASAFVKEFLPDRLKINASLSKTSKQGWVDIKDLNGSAILKNLYGTPASARQMKGTVRLDPSGFSFEEWKDYQFFDPLIGRRKNWKGETINLGALTTDDNGETKFTFGLERFDDVTCQLNFTTEGFEADGGRSVQDETGVLVSPLPYVVGYKADGNLGYITRGQGGRMVEFIAVDPSLKRIALEKLTLTINEQTYISVLTKRDNGNYAYESVLREKPVREETVSIAVAGWKYALPCERPGTFKVEIRDEEHGVLSRLTYTVAGAGLVTRSLEKNAELNIKLSKDQYRAGETIEIAVTAPYTGSGLITIEREHVYAHKWFKADGTSSVQTITVPADFDGTGYVNVSFVRALDSKEVFMSPLSYAVAPFTANREARHLGIELRAAANSRPGEGLAIHYRADRPAKIVVYAVDAGILQVTKYQTPDPLEYAFRKAALGVRTTQIVDLILPEFSILRNASSVGGDGDAPTLNPFRRVTEKPVVYWSSIIDADTTERTVVYPVPDYFSGTLTLMAVGVSPDALGSTQGSTLIRAPFTLTAGVPTMAAPGDQFEVGVTVANNFTGSGPTAALNLRGDGDDALEIVRSPANPLVVPEGKEITATFQVRVKDRLGSARLGFRASLGKEESGTHVTLSVRPAAPFVTLVRGGSFQKDNLDVPINRSMYPDYRDVQATLSSLPLGLAHGLDAYLKKYPFGCSEQITSGAFARMALADEGDFGLTRAEVVAQLERAFAILRRRQNDQGEFGYWAMDAKAKPGIHFVTVYVTHFLSEAKAAGFAVPPDCLKLGLGCLQKMVTMSPDSLFEARTQAYAIYVLTREGVVTTNYVLNLRDSLDRDYHDRWLHDLTGPYLAATLSLLKKEDEARKIINAYQAAQHDARELGDFYQPLGADAQFLSILARHFPDRLKTLTTPEFRAILSPIGQGDFSTLSAAYAVQALKSYSQFVARNPAHLSIGAIKSNAGESLLAAEGGALLRRASVPDSTREIRFHAQDGNTPNKLGVFYQVVEGGYDRNPPKERIIQGLEVYREYRDAVGKLVSQVKLGEPITVTIRVRSRKDRDIPNVAILDLLPGGFEIVGSSLQPGLGTVPGMDYTEVREDRAVIFGTISTYTQSITYQIKAVNRGEFTVPPVFAESMYDRNLRALGMGGKITVVEAAK